MKLRYAFLTFTMIVSTGNVFCAGDHKPDAEPLVTLERGGRPAVTFEPIDAHPAIHTETLAIMEEKLQRDKPNHAFESADHPLTVHKSREHRTHLRPEKASTIIEMLEKDHEDNVSDLIKYRWCFRKAANITEVFGNGLLYLGSGLATIAGGVKMVGSDSTSNILLFTSTACFAAHVTFIGLAKCSSREEREREKLLEKLAEAVDFNVTPLDRPMGEDDEGNGANSSAPAKVV